MSKTVAPERLRAAVAAGIASLGESRVQEAALKTAAVPGARWILVGRLQSNKARQALGLFDVIHSVDSLDLAGRLDRLAAQFGRVQPVYLQVNVDEERQKAGFEPDDLLAAARELDALGDLRLRGLMTVGRAVTQAAEARPTFRRLRLLSDELRSRSALLGPGLSMGMSDDFEVALEEGATVLRVGRAIFGP